MLQRKNEKCYSESLGADLEVPFLFHAGKHNISFLIICAAVLELFQRISIGKSKIICPSNASLFQALIKFNLQQISILLQKKLHDLSGAELNIFFKYNWEEKISRGLKKKKKETEKITYFKVK